MGCVLSTYVVVTTAQRRETGRQCFDGLDNDHDGHSDCADPDCQKDQRIGQRCREMTRKHKRQHAPPPNQRCGTTWGDANKKCGKACPHDTSEECPDGEDCFSALSTRPCVALEEKTSWLQIQGPGWSDEYIGEAGPDTWKPRMDLRRALLGFLHFRMPRPSRWERVERARLVEALAATPGVYANFTALHAHVQAALTKVHGHQSSSWSMESVGEQCSVAATQQW